jgi:hypothetical protein
MPVWRVTASPRELAAGVVCRAGLVVPFSPGSAGTRRPHFNHAPRRDGYGVPSNKGGEDWMAPGRKDS